MSAPITFFPMVTDEVRDAFAGHIRLFLHSTGGISPGAQPDPGTGTPLSGGTRILLGKTSEWQPSRHDLVARLVVASGAPWGALFGNQSCADARCGHGSCRGKHAVAPTGASIALVFEYRSADGEVRGRGSCDAISLADCGRELAFEVKFQRGTMRGTTELQLQAVLCGAAAQPGPGEAALARVKGAILGSVSHVFSLVVDGDGSLFPVKMREAGREEALWQLEASWDDVEQDEFCVDNVALVLNSSHPAFEELKGDPAAPYQNYLFRQIAASWVALFVLQVHQHTHGQGQLDVWRRIEDGSVKGNPGTIAAAASHFVCDASLPSHGPGGLIAASKVFAASQVWVERSLPPPARGLPAAGGAALGAGL